ncbi:hypothetical protein NFI96_029521, partial [Prochilodus magdalenae]
MAYRSSLSSEAIISCTRNSREVFLNKLASTGFPVTEHTALLRKQDQLLRQKSFLPQWLPQPSLYVHQESQLSYQ